MCKTENSGTLDLGKGFFCAYPQCAFDAECGKADKKIVEKIAILLISYEPCTENIGIFVANCNQRIQSKEHSKLDALV